jgi:hypothetical protein
LVYSSYLGGTPATLGYGIAVDSAGDAYVAGATYSSDFPTTPGAYQTVCSTGLYPPPSCNYSGFVTKFNPSGSALVYSTLLVNSGDAFSSGIAVDTAGNAYVTGGGALVTKLNPAGSALVYASYLACCGGTGIAIDGSGDAWVTGRTNSNDFPTTPSAFQRKCNAGGSSCSNRGAAFVSKVDPSGSVLVYSTYLGGSKGGGSAGYAVAVDPGDNAYVLGWTNSTNFPVTPGAFQMTYGGSSSPYDASAFVAKFYFAATTTALSSSLNPSNYGQKVTWTATVTAVGPIAPTGKVKFTWGSHFIGSATLDASGVATLTQSDLNADPYPLTATYEGDANNAPSTSAILSQVVQQATSASTLTSSPNPSTQGQAVTFTAKITSPTTVPKGPVTFTVGKTVLGSVELSAGKATFTASTLAVGSTTVTATYAGDSNISESSASVTQTVQ